MTNGYILNSTRFTASDETRNIGQNPQLTIITWQYLTKILINFVPHDKNFLHDISMQKVKYIGTNSCVVTNSRTKGWHYGYLTLVQQIQWWTISYLAIPSFGVLNILQPSFHLDMSLLIPNCFNQMRTFYENAAN